jgi:hypothetical protein
MDVPIGVQVYCEDELCGRSTQVILNPATNKVTHLVVEGEETDPAYYLVPIEWLDASTPQELVLHCSHDQLVRSTGLHGASTLGDATGTASFCGDHPLSELAVRQGAWVEAQGSYAGLVDEFLIDPGTCGVTHVVLHEVHLWGSKRIAVPVSSILSIEEDRVRLRLNVDGLEDMSIALT